MPTCALALLVLLGSSSACSDGQIPCPDEAETVTVASCSNGMIPCPSESPSVGICVPSIKPYCARDIWRNPFASYSARAADLVPRLTLAERVNLLQTSPINASEVPRLGLARSTVAECLHGYAGGAPSTVFPQSTTLAASFNGPLVTAVAAVIGKEARAWRNAWVAAGNASVPPPSLTCFAPQINIQRDPRWGRGQETFGEDPFLTAQMVSSYVLGLQGGGGGGMGYMLAAATTKHFLAYAGASTRGQHSPTEVYLSWRDQMDTFEPAWRAAVTAGSAGVMCAYSSLCHDDTNTTCALPPPTGFGVSHGIPMCADADLLNGWLRGGAGGVAPPWDGLVVGDCGAVQFIETDHQWAPSQEGAAAAALNAGVDFDCSISSGHGFAALVNASEAGLVNTSSIDRALSRYLIQQFKLGLYDDEELVPWAALTMDGVNSVANRGLAARAAREGIVLLSNKRAVLPLVATLLTGAGSLLVTGPNAMLVASGNYATQTDVYVTPFLGLAAALPVGVAVLEAGCASVTSNNTSGFAAAVAAARNARVVVAAMGLDTSVEFEDSTRDDLALPGAQEGLIAALAAALAMTDTPLVLVLFGGSAVAPSPAALHSASAVVWAGYGGEEAGTALADVLLGRYNPGGRLPFTTYADVADLPPYANMSMTGAPYGRTYRYFDGPETTFRFGDGISYTKFYVALASVSTTTLAPCASLVVDAFVSNTGKYDGDTVAMVFVRLVNTTLRAPLHALAGFSRVAAAAGSTMQVVRFVLPPDSFTVIDGEARRRILEPASALIFVGTNQPREVDWEGGSVTKVTLGGPITDIQTCKKKK